MRCEDARALAFIRSSQYDETPPVLIVRGSLIGLSMSLFLSWQGIPSLVVERHPAPRSIRVLPA